MRRIGESATLRVTRRIAELRAAGREVISFGAGEPDFASPEVAVEAACSALRRGFTKYTPHTGTADLRRALAKSYAERWSAPWSADQVVVTVGAKAALFELSLALFEADGEVVVPTPCWVSFPEQIRFAGAEPILVATDFADGFAIRADDLLAVLNERTRAVLVNAPCNPTGGLLVSEELERLVEGCAARGVLVVADETYERFYYDGASHASAAGLAAAYPDSVVVVGSFSKTYAMTGWRVGYALGPSWIVDALSTIQSHATSNVTSFAMAGALAALEGAEEEVAVMLEEYQARRDLVSSALSSMPGVELRPPGGAFYAFPRVSALYGGRVESSVDLATFLLDEAGVAVVPGAAFADDRHVRLSFASSRSDLERGLERMDRALRRLA